MSTHGLYVLICGKAKITEKNTFMKEKAQKKEKICEKKEVTIDIKYENMC